MRTSTLAGGGLRARWLAAAVPVLAVFLASRAHAEAPSPAALLFSQRCSTCHTVGDGDKVGPDLKGVLERRDEAWLTRFIQSPGALIDAGDPVATELLAKFNGIRMPDQQLTDEERTGLFAYLRECTKLGGCKPASLGPKLASDATPDEVEQGRQLFAGALRFAQGGPACVDCHNVRGVGMAGGGTLGRDLTFAFARLGDKGLNPALQDMDFPLMKSLYAKAPLSSEEQYALKAYLWDVSRDGTPPRRDRDFVYLGAVGVLVALGFIGLVWGGRGTGARPS
ncbi:cytochrome c [Myxococcaceae bacterium GXIMD 01537]